MSRRSTRLVTSRYYQGDDDDRLSTSSASSSLLGGSQTVYKESPVRSFRKKSGSVKRSTVAAPPDTHQSTSYYHETTYVSGGLTSADYNSILEKPLEKESYWEQDLARQRRVTGGSYSSSATNGLADAKVSYDTYGTSSGYSSEEDYTGRSLSEAGGGGYGFSGAVSKAGSLLWQVVTSPGRALGFLYWWIGTLWYRLTTSASLLDVFVLTRSALKKVILLLLLLLLLAATAWGAWHFYPFGFGMFRSSQVGVPISEPAVPPVFVRMQNKEDHNSSLLYQHLLSRLESLEKRFQNLASESASWQQDDVIGRTERLQTLDRGAGQEGLTHQETLVLLEELMTQRATALKEDFKKDSIVLMQGELEALREEQQRDLHGVLKKIGQLSKELETQMLHMKAEFTSPPQEDQKQLFLQEISRLDKQLGRLRLELGDVAESQRGIASQVQSFPGQIQGLRDEVKQQFPEWVHGLLLPPGTSSSGAASLSGVFLHRDELQQQLLDLERRILAMTREEQKRSPQHASARVGVALQGGGANGVTEEQVHEIVNRALSRFSEDRIGLVDYALESSGASVLSTRCSETYETKTALLSLFGVPLWYQSQSPRVILQPDSNPGNCWAFRGSQGFAVIRLSSRIRPTAVTLEHVPRSLSPKGTIPSAPKDFAVYGHEEEAQHEGMFLGQFTYNQDGAPIQTFWFQGEPLGTYQIVELKILSNWGHPEYTCIYRFRVHGESEE
ncbi:SUN domain-containing protein 2 isoform X2 [Ambystoma mexicanum]|uniref:SUN domain-containing protein 2 isoform X2 n=1 Tax=Ambystoma mexicanum TaxID=8296 RepID=UPI0037E9B9A9